MKKQKIHTRKAGPALSVNGRLHLAKEEKVGWFFRPTLNGRTCGPSVLRATVTDMRARFTPKKRTAGDSPVCCGQIPRICKV